MPGKIRLVLLKSQLLKYILNLEWLEGMSVIYDYHHKNLQSRNYELLASGHLYKQSDFVRNCF